jgi:predicted ATPase
LRPALPDATEGAVANEAGALAIFLMGAIGSGKTTLGRALALELGGGHVEGDDHQQPPKAWFATSLSTSRSTLRAVLAVAASGRPAVVSYPLRCREWIFYRRRLADAGIRSAFVSLVAGEEALLAPSRGRAFTDEERRRIREMLQQGYGARRFADLAVRTDQGDAQETLARLIRGLARCGFLPDAR